MTSKITIILTAAVMAAAAAAYADTVDYPLSFDITEYSYDEVVGGDEETYWLYEVEDGGVYAPPGEPTIPTRAYDVVIPFGSTEVSVEIINTSYHDEEDVAYQLYPGQEPMKTNDEGEEWEWTDPSDTYNKPAYYPAEPLVKRSQGLWRGHFACQVDLYTMKYHPVDYHVQKLASATLRVTYTPPDPAPEAERWEWEHIYNKWSDYIKTIVLNPDDVYDYREPVNFVDVIGYSEYEENGEIITVAYNQESEFYSSSVPIPDDEHWPEEGSFPYPYIVITNDKAYHWTEAGIEEEEVNLTEADDDLIEWKTDKGVPIIVKTVDDIKERYSQEGNEYWDPQVAIRKFLKAAIKWWGPEYIALIGDVDNIKREGIGNYSPDWGQYGIVPIRVLADGDYPCYKMIEGQSILVDEPVYWTHVLPCDLYYTDFNDQPNDWDYSGDGIFGEPTHDKIDAYKPDVACGWIPASNQTELENYIAKVLKYEQDPDLTKIGGHTYTHRFVHLLTDEGLGKEMAERKTPDYLPGFYIKKMYESPEAPGGGAGEFPTYPQPHDVNDALNEGYGLIEIDCHGHPNFHYILTQGTNDVRTQIWASRPNFPHRYVNNMIFPSTVEDLNTSRYGIIVSNSCKTNCFDYKTSDIVSEWFLFDDDGGGVAYVANTRDGWWTSSAEISQAFYKVLLNKTDTPNDDWPFLGPAETWGRARYLRDNPKYHHYPFYSHNLCGDPELNVWTANDPKVLTFGSIDTWYVEGEGYHVKVNVKKDGGVGYLSFVCLNAGDKAYLINLANDEGNCEFIVPEAASNVHLTATMKNCVPAYKTDLNIP